MDFTLKIYRELVQSLLAAEYQFQTFEEFIRNPAGRAVVLRHDIDKLPGNALRMAQLEYDLGVRGSYYFRVIPSVWSPEVMRQIVELGHELGYHYEDLTIARGDHEAAILHFKRQLKLFRRIYPVRTVCMHGSPLSRHDNRDLWETYDYRTFGIIAEPYFDIDFNQVFYATDTGRKWNHAGASIRDRVNSGFDIRVTSTGHLMELAWEGRLPKQVMINTHPHRWFDFGTGWIKELVGQNLKNIAKTFLIKMRKQ